MNGTTRTTWTLDPAGRYSTATTASNSTGSWVASAVKTDHYDTDSDSPAWTLQSASTGACTTNVVGIDSAMDATYTSASGDIALQLSDLHGDVVMTYPVNDASASAAVTVTDEFGKPIAGTAAASYGYLGAQQRSSATASGDVLMGVRLYNLTLGRYLQTDPVR